jgi:DNA-binding CsgD family transcriptional regulator
LYVELRIELCVRVLSRYDLFVIGHLIVVYGFLVVAAGIVAIVIAAMGARRTRDPHRTSYLAFIISFTASVALYLVLAYAEVNLDLGDRLLLVWGALDALVDVLVVLTAVFFYHSLFGLSFAKRVETVLVVVSAASYGLFGVAAFAGTAGVIGRASVYGAMGFYYILFVYLIVLCVVNLGRLTAWRERFFGFGLFIFALVGIAESLMTLPKVPGSQLVDLIAPHRFYLSTIPFLLWCLASSIVLWRTDHGQRPRRGLAAFCERHGISLREREVLELILEGYSNAEIGDRLFISLQTVKSHAHHLYEKTGLGGRVALLATVGDQLGDHSSD